MSLAHSFHWIVYFITVGFVSFLYVLDTSPYIVWKYFLPVWGLPCHPLIAQLVHNPPAMQETLVQFLGWEDLLERDRLPTLVFLGFPCGSACKESTCNVGDLGLTPGLGRSSGEGKTTHTSIPT